MVSQTLSDFPVSHPTNDATGTPISLLTPSTSTKNPQLESIIGRARKRGVQKVVKEGNDPKQLLKTVKRLQQKSPSLMEFPEDADPKDSQDALTYALNLTSPPSNP